jgi:hypothetical protein
MSILDKIEEIILKNEKGLLCEKGFNSFYSQDDKDNFWHYHPLNKDYYFEGNPSFTFEYRDIQEFVEYPIVMLRDGYAGLVSFFIKNPSPPEYLDTYLLIPKKFENLIPKQWEGKVACYHFENIKRDLSRKNLIIYGHGTEDVFWKEGPQEKLASLKKMTDEFNFEKTICLFPQRESKYSSGYEKSKKYDLALLKEMYRSFGFEIQHESDIIQFLDRNDISDFSFCSLDVNHIVYYDCYLKHKLYALGGISIDIEKYHIPEDSLRFSLSLNHEVVITQADLAKSIFPKIFISAKMNGFKDPKIESIFQSSEMKDIYLKNFK